jgi:hypothetical protein
MAVKSIFCDHTGAAPWHTDGVRACKHACLAMFAFEIYEQTRFFMKGVRITGYARACKREGMAMHMLSLCFVQMTSHIKHT